MPLTPDTTMITLVWHGVYLDGTPATGNLKLTYDGGNQLDAGNDDSLSVMVYRSEINRTIVEKRIDTEDKFGNPVRVVVGHAEFQVPASNDEDLLGSGGTYTLTEELTRGGGRTYSFPVDKDVPGGRIILHELPGTTTPDPGTVYTGISVSTFSALEARVTNLEENPAAATGTVTSVNSIAPDVTGNVDLTKAAVGLSAVDNTADADKPVSTAQQTALDAKADLVAGKVPSEQLPPIALSADTFVVASQAAMLALSADQGDVAVRTDQNKSYRLQNNVPTVLANWIEIPAQGAVTSVAGKSGTVSLVKADVGLSSVDNTSDANKPVSTATQTALNAKEATIAAGTTAQYWRGDKSWQALTSSTVGLGSVNNTADSAKPVSTAQQAALDLKLNIADQGGAWGVRPTLYINASTGVWPARNLPTGYTGPVNWDGSDYAGTPVAPSAAVDGDRWIKRTG